MKTDNSFLIRQLQNPQGIVDVVLDTDTYNEIDDQYALAYMLLSAEKLRTQAVYAAPFHNEKSNSPGHGMELSYKEILNIMTLCGRDDLHKAAYRGSENYLPNETTPVESDAARDLVKRAMEYTPENPLYVLTIGAITNIASALLMEPAITDRIVIVWLGGSPHHFPIWPEFNMTQDIAAARVVFGSGAPLVQLPCAGVVSHLTTTEPELRQHIKGKSALGDYLYEYSCKVAVHDGGNTCWSRVIWDVSAVAWVLSPRFIRDMTVPAPIPTYENGYVTDPTRHFMKVAYHINRDAIFEDLFKKIANA
ncbi:MAG: nucleoside hydrolase [Firmicutes bacterium]|nr:nucleoside hydrolase [Bacillota bacterium]